MNNHRITPHEYGLKSGQLLIDQIMMSLQTDYPFLTRDEKILLIEAIQHVLDITLIRLQEADNSTFHISGLNERLTCMSQP